MGSDKYTAGASSSWSTAGDKFATNEGYSLGSYDELEMAHKYELPRWAEYEECIVDASGYAEISACREGGTAAPQPVDAFQQGVDDFMAGISRFFASLAPKAAIRLTPKAVAYEYEECLVNAENAAEIAACRA